jgi:small subunit ribosomal protein S10
MNFNKRIIRIKLNSFNQNLLRLTAFHLLKEVNICLIRAESRYYFNFPSVNCKYEELESICHAREVVSGPVFLPVKKRKYCLLRSPHVNKKSREHFEFKSYTCFIDINIDSIPSNLSSFIDSLSLKIPLGIENSVQLISY